MTSLVDRVAKIKKDLLEFKASQSSQNDSYQFYLYRTDNLYIANTDKSYKIQFVPEAKDYDQVVCMFRDFDMPSNFSTGICYTNDPFTYYFTSGTWTDPPVDQRKVYVTCIANCKGALVVTPIQ